MKVLYVHGYNSNANSTTSKLIRELSDFEVHTITYNPEHPIEAIKDIRNYCKKYKIDLIIGSSLGGFLTMNCFGYKRIVINPCFKPSIKNEPISFITVDGEFIPKAFLNPSINGLKMFS